MGGSKDPPFIHTEPLQSPSIPKGHTLFCLCRAFLSWNLTLNWDYHPVINVLLFLFKLCCLSSHYLHFSIYFLCV